MKYKFLRCDPWRIKFATGRTSASLLPTPCSLFPVPCSLWYN
ncbi:hypothetical protein [Moorena sp. SIOASIH]|nr:hypothetical protein [Moorena sp. SIOASIH]